MHGVDADPGVAQVLRPLLGQHDLCALAARVCSRPVVGGRVRGEGVGCGVGVGVAVGVAVAEGVGVGVGVAVGVGVGVGVPPPDGNTRT